MVQIDAPLIGIDGPVYLISKEIYEKVVEFVSDLTTSSCFEIKERARNLYPLL